MQNPETIVTVERVIDGVLHKLHACFRGQLSEWEIQGTRVRLNETLNDFEGCRIPVRELVKQFLPEMRGRVFRSEDLRQVILARHPQTRRRLLELSAHLSAAVNRRELLRVGRDQFELPR